jgi:hypothetical protein
MNKKKLFLPGLAGSRKDMTTRKYILLFLLLTTVLLPGCSTGHLKFAGKNHALNKSEIRKEEDGQYRVWVWRYEKNSLLDIIGSSPAGIQMLLPEGLKAGTTCDVRRECKLWVRELWYFFGDLAGSLWVSADSGTITISEWDPENQTVAGRFEARTKKGPVSGTFHAN